MAFQQGDFVKLNYTGKLEDGTIFDTTDKKIAEEAGITQGTFEPAVICVGQRHLLPGLDKAIVGLETGKHTINIDAAEGFGKKSAKLLQLTPLAQFKRQGFMPEPGMEVNVDGKYGVVRSVSGGRVIVDYNHPLASHDLTYEIELLGAVTKLQEQVEALVKIAGIPFKEVKVEAKHAIIIMEQSLPQPIMDSLQAKIKELTKTETVSFESGEKKATKEEGEKSTAPAEAEKKE